MSAKSTNIRQLMNLLSQKYFGNQLNYTSNKPQTPIHKPFAKIQDTNFNILSPVTSCKTSPKFNRISPSQGKPTESKGGSNENFNYFEQTKNYFEQTRAKFKKPAQTILKPNERRKLQLRCTNNGSYSYVSGTESGSEMEQSQSGLVVSSYSRKGSQKDLMKNSSGTYLHPVTFSSITQCENAKNTNSRLVKESLIESKGPSKKLFLKENSSSVHKLESNSTISQSRGSVYTKKQSVQRDNTMKKRDQDMDAYKIRNEQRQQEQDKRLKEQVQFYRQKCINLERQNSQLKEKVSTYEEQFAQEKLLVQNLKNMISKREQQIDEIIQKKLAGFEKKQQLLNCLEGQNSALRSELEEVTEVLKQQESIIMELYAQHRHKSVHKAETSKEERAKSVTKVSHYPGQTCKNTYQQGDNNVKKIFLKSTSNRSQMALKSSSNGCKQMGTSPYAINSSGNNARPHTFKYTSQHPRESITQTSYEDDYQSRTAQ